MGKFEEEAQLCALHRVDGIGSAALKEIATRGLSPYEVLHMQEEQLKLFLAPKAVTNLLLMQREDIYKTYENYVNQGIQFLPYGSEAFPERLRNIPTPPKSIYVLGRLPEKQRLTVGIIGARLCSEYGRYMARYYGKGLAERGIGIISGMADGIDGISQRAALEAGGYSLGVLGCGVDVCYPKDNMPLYERLRAEGGLVSEYPPGTQARSSLFPPRNRIISAFSNALLVVEARKKSGTAITVEMALQQGKDIWAVPGRANEVLSAGCNSLIREGAGIANSLDDFLDDLSTLFSIQTMDQSLNQTKSSLADNTPQNRICALLKNRSLTADEIALLMDSPEDLLTMLLNMELEGLIKFDAGRYSLT